MEKNFAIGLFLGMIGGAIIVSNSYKVRKLVREGQQQIKDKVSKLAKCNKQRDDYEDLEDWF